MKRPQVNLVLSDAHCPFQNKRLLKRVCRLAEDLHPDQLVLAGDMLDLYSLSRHHAGSLADLGQMNLSWEYDRAQEMMDGINRATKKSRRYYIYGNHEDNFNRWIRAGDNAKVGNETRRPEERLRLREQGYTVMTDWKNDSVKLGAHLDVIHGTYTTVHTAKKHLDEFEGSVMFGHAHRCQTFVSGKRGAYCIGFLGDRNSTGFSYMPRASRNRWANAFAVVYVLDDGSFLANVVQCWNDRFIFNGKLY